jgi:hypothetical protein
MNLDSKHFEKIANLVKLLLLNRIEIKGVAVIFPQSRINILCCLWIAAIFHICFCNLYSGLRIENLFEMDYS